MGSRNWNEIQVVTSRQTIKKDNDGVGVDVFRNLVVLEVGSAVASA